MKRARSDSAAAAVTAAQSAALGPIEPPAHVCIRPGDLVFWEGIVTARARDTWNETDLVQAGNLARCQADIERLQREVEKEGDIVSDARGTPIINPRHKLIETLSRRAVSLARMLHVHAEATVGRSRDVVNALQNEKNAAAEDDDLIPTLKAVK